jgi:6-phosphogluconate dehydrogenase
LNAKPLGLIGLGTMGQNLALNFRDHGYEIVVWNLESDVTSQFTEGVDAITGTSTLEELVAALTPPRRILLMIKAGAAVDEVLESLLPLLDQGDVVIDGGNAHFADTRRRVEQLAERGVDFAGLGVSGGELGARHGPSLMFGGPDAVWRELADPLTAIAADGDFGPCAMRFGDDGAGHFVKMAHNGIEYADMQLIAEAYDIMRRGLSWPSNEIADQFEHWNEGPLKSYLVELTGKVLAKTDADGPLVNGILDVAEQKGTGRWTIATAIDLGVAVPTITAAVDARVVSAEKTIREALGSVYSPPPPSGRVPTVEDLHDALFAAKVIAYSQGLQLIRAGSQSYGWDIRIADVAKAWSGGCIIRAALLGDIVRAHTENPELPVLISDAAIRAGLSASVPGLRHIVGWAAKSAIPTPAFGSALAWFDSMQTTHLPQNLIQAQRDAFGAHTYRRLDDPDTPVHTDWLS